jgi:tetrahydromethanopterin S-methyltransferase subunit F
MRTLLALLIGLAAGVLLTVIAMNTLRKANAYPFGVMAVLAAQMGHIDRQIEARACTAADFEAPLATLVALGNDLEPAFLPTADDAAFSRYAADYRLAVESMLAAEPADCAAAERALDAVSASCQACHAQFKG